MGRHGHLVLLLDADYLLDDRVVELDTAAVVTHLAAMLTAKRLLTDGRLSRGQIRHAASRVADVDGAIDALVRVGLLEEDDGGLRLRSWDQWNKAAADVEAEMERARERGAYGNHKRWHEAAGRFDGECQFCVKSGTRSGSESGTRSGSESGTRSGRRNKTATGSRARVVPGESGRIGYSSPETETETETVSDSLKANHLLEASRSSFSSSLQATTKPSTETIAKAIAAQSFPPWEIRELGDSQRAHLFRMAGVLERHEVVLAELPAAVAKWKREHAYRSGELFNPSVVVRAWTTGTE